MTRDDYDLGSGLSDSVRIWLLDLARQLPSTVQLHGFDISPDQFQPKSLWPVNVTLGPSDSLSDPLPSLVGQYNIVHLRMWASNLRESDTEPLLNHLKRLLKPGGFIQWEEADPVHQVVDGSGAAEFESRMNRLFKMVVGLDYGWVADLPNRLGKASLQVLQAEKRPFEPSLVPLGTNTYLLALREILHGIRRFAPSHLFSAVAEGENALCNFSLKKGAMIYNWGPVTLLAQNGGH